MEDNRRFERFSSDMIFWIRPEGSDGDFEPFDIENISAGGILCNTSSLFGAGTRVELEFELPQYTDLIRATAEVRHQSKDDEGNRIGLQFAEVQGLETDQLMGYLEELFK